MNIEPVYLINLLVPAAFREGICSQFHSVFVFKGTPPDFIKAPQNPQISSWLIDFKQFTGGFQNINVELVG